MKRIRQTSKKIVMLAVVSVMPLADAQPAADSSAGNVVEEQSPESVYQAAKALLKAKDGEESSKKGFQMMLESANQGHLPAIAGVAYLYHTGTGTPKDNAMAAKWFRVAAEKGHAISQYNFGKLLLADEIPLPDGMVGREAQHKEGVEWLRKAADQGLHDAQSTYGIILYKGDFGTERDAVAAAGYLKPASEAGDLDATNTLGMMYKRGRGVPRDSGVSEQLFRKAAMAGHVKAQANLGEHLNPSSKNPDQRIEAMAWLFIAEEAESPFAKKHLAPRLLALPPDDIAAARKKAAEIKQTIKTEKN
jgi:TPR repeat protein